MLLIIVWLIFIILMGMGAIDWLISSEYILYSGIMLYITYICNSVADNNKKS